MQQPHKPTPSQRFKDYHASNTALFWACAGSAVVAIVVGFAWGGWVTGGSARAMAADSAAQARQELAAREAPTLGKAELSADQATTAQ